MDLSNSRESANALSRPSNFASASSSIIPDLPNESSNVMQRLRERGIYALPDGKEFVVHAVFRGGYVFYTPEAWEFAGHRYALESNVAGQIRLGGQPTDLRIEDLTDTTRTAQSRSSRKAEQEPRL